MFPSRNALLPLEGRAYCALIDGIPGFIKRFRKFIIESDKAFRFAFNDST